MKHLHKVIFNVVQFRLKEVLLYATFIAISLGVGCDSWIPIPIAYVGSFIVAVLIEHKTCKSNL